MADRCFPELGGPPAARRVCRGHKRGRVARGPHPSDWSSRTALERRVQLPSSRRHLCAREDHKSHSSDVGSLRELPHHRTSHVYVDVSAGAGTGTGGGAIAGAPVDRTNAGHGCNVLGFVLGTASVAASNVGFARRNASCIEAGHFELLGEWILERIGCRLGGRTAGGGSA